MKILLLQSYLGREDIALYPLGLSYIGTSLSDHQVFAFDPNVSSAPYGDMEKMLRECGPEVVGISIRNIDTLSFNDRFLYLNTLKPSLEIIRTAAPGAKIVLGGAGFSIYAEDIMKGLPDVDFGIYREGEESIVELLENLDVPRNVKGLYYRDNGRIVFTGIRENPGFELNNVPRRDLFDLSLYTHPLSVGVQSKRGCSLKCTYCNYPFLNGASLRSRPPEEVVDEIEDMVRKKGVTHIMFADGVFNIPRKHAEEICGEIIKRGLKIKWGAYFTEINFDEAFMRLIKDSGCFLVFFSPDGYSNRSLKALKKPIKNKDIARTYKMALSEKGINFDFCFFFNPPGQDPVSFASLMWLMIKTNFLLPRRKHVRISINNPRMEPDTKLYNQAIDEGIIKKGTSLLPWNEEQLSHLFYNNPSSGYINSLMSLLYNSKGILKGLLGKKRKEFV